MMNYDYVTLADTKQQFFLSRLCCASAVDKLAKDADGEHAKRGDVELY